MTVKISDLSQKLNSALEELAATQAQFYIAVTVTDILSNHILRLCFIEVKNATKIT